MAEYVNLIDTERILFMVDNVREGWQEYIYNSGYCQAKVRFDNEERTNYVSDLINYLEDTIHLLENFKINDSYQSALYDSIAVLQIMYIQQDLMKELCDIYRIETDNKDNQIRLIRNELIGHPISRNKKGTLRSSVFITDGTAGLSLEYIRYHQNNDYKFELKSYEWPVLFSIHENYLIDHLNLILKKTDDILIEFKNTLIELKKSIPDIPTPDLVERVEKSYEQYNKDFHPYSADNILYNISMGGKHPRYDLTNSIYNRGLKDAITERHNFIDGFVNRKFIREVDKPESPEFLITFGNDDCEDDHDNKITFVVNKAPTEKPYNYAFSKLHNPDHPFGISYFKRKFASDEEIMTELNNMSIINSADFHISYEYLRYLLQKKGLLQ